MKTIRLFFALTAAIAASIAYAPPRALADMHDVPGGLCQSGGQQVPCVTNLQRQEVTPGVAHYSWTLRVGTETNDVIGIHRMTKEWFAWVPRSSAFPIMLVHGDVHNFTTAFLTGTAGNAQSSMAAYLASDSIDVWGVDLRWSQVPGTTTDFAFMQTWNLEKDALDVRTALGVARLMRGITGSGMGPMALGGHSRGGQIAYVVAQQESSFSPSSPFRSVDNLVILDVPLKTDNETLRASTCAAAAQMQAQLNAGTYVDATGAFARTVGDLAFFDASGPTPIFPSPPFPPLTNREAALTVGGATYMLAPSLPYFHWAGSSLNAYNLPSAFLFSDEDVFIQTLRSLPPFEALGTVQQGLQVVCSSVPALDSKLADVTAPVLYIGAAGGFGDTGYYTTTLLGSTDVELVTVGSTGNPYTDFAHSDLLQAENAPSLVWDPVSVWLMTH